MRRAVELEVPCHHLAETRRLEHQRHFVDRLHVRHAYHRLARHVGEQGDLLLEVVVDRQLGATDDRVRLDTDRAQRLHRVLGRLGLHLLPAHDRHERAVHIEDVLPAEVVFHLPDRFQEGEALDVSHRPPHLHDDHIRLRVLRRAEDLFLDHVGDVRDHLHGRPQVVAAALARDYLLVDLPGRHIGSHRQVLVDEALVVTEVEVGLRAVVGDEDLTVLVGAHRPGVDVQVRVELLQGDGEVAGLQDVPDRRRSDSFAERGDDTAGDKNVLRHRGPSWRFFKCYRRRRAAKH